MGFEGIFTCPGFVHLPLSLRILTQNFVSRDQNLILRGVCEVKFFDTTNGLGARTKKRIAAKPLRILTLKWHLVDKIKFKGGSMK